MYETTGVFNGFWFQTLKFRGTMINSLMGKPKTIHELALEGDGAGLQVVTMVLTCRQS